MIGELALLTTGLAVFSDEKKGLQELVQRAWLCKDPNVLLDTVSFEEKEMLIGDLMGWAAHSKDLDEAKRRLDIAWFFCDPTPGMMASSLFSNLIGERRLQFGGRQVVEVNQNDLEEAEDPRGWLADFKRKDLEFVDVSDMKNDLSDQDPWIHRVDAGHPFVCGGDEQRMLVALIATTDDGRETRLYLLPRYSKETQDEWKEHWTEIIELLTEGKG